MKMDQIMVAVVDGQGGGVGRALTERIRKAYPDLYIRALGTNTLATSAMLKGGANDGATGENAVIYNVRRAQVILGPIAVLCANGLLGEVTPSMAEAVGGSDAVKILLPSQKCRIKLAIGPTQSMQNYLDEAITLLGEELQHLTEN